MAAGHSAHQPLCCEHAVPSTSCPPCLLICPASLSTDVLVKDVSMQAHMHHSVGHRLTLKPKLTVQACPLTCWCVTFP